MGLAPAMEMLPLLSICTPGCVVSVVIGLVDPAPRDPMASGRSINSRPVFVSAMLETSVWIVGSIAAVTFTDSTTVASCKVLSARMVCRARSSKPVMVADAESRRLKRDVVGSRFEIDEGVGAVRVRDSLAFSGRCLC